MNKKEQYTGGRVLFFYFARKRPELGFIERIEPKSLTRFCRKKSNRRKSRPELNRNRFRNRFTVGAIFFNGLSGRTVPAALQTRKNNGIFYCKENPPKRKSFRRVIF